MSGPADVLYHAAKRIGYYAPDDPEPGSEAGRYWAEHLDLVVHAVRQHVLR